MSFGNPLAVPKICFPLGARTNFDRYASFCSLYHPPDALATSPKTSALPTAPHLDRLNLIDLCIINEIFDFVNILNGVKMILFFGFWITCINSGDCFLNIHLRSMRFFRFIVLEDTKKLPKRGRSNKTV